MGINGNRSNETLSREISRGKAAVIIARRRFLDFARNDGGVCLGSFVISSGAACRYGVKWELLQ